jgi:adenylate kinase family enzyme
MSFIHEVDVRFAAEQRLMRRAVSSERCRVLPRRCDDTKATRMSRIHITGASGAGTSTLGAALAGRLRHPHVDADSIYWLPTDPPFTTPRSREDRSALVRKLLPMNGAWVFSGSAPGWTTSVEPAYDLVVFLTLDPAVRLERLLRRETERYGARLALGGDMAAASAKFLEWAAAYDVAGL